MLSLRCRRAVLRRYGLGRRGPRRVRAWTPPARSSTGSPIEHTADGIADADPPAGQARRRRRAMPVGIERPNGRLVDLLLEAGHPVVPVSPNAIKTWRDGEVLSGAKSDAGDAAVIAEYLRLRPAPAALAVPATPTRPRRCAPWSAPATTWSTCASRPPTSSPRCWTRTGPAPRPSSPTSSPRSRWTFLTRYPTAGRRPPPRRETPGRVPGQARLLRPPPGRRAARPGCAHAPAGTTGDSADRGRPRRRAGPGRRADARSTRAVKDLDRSVRRPPRGAPGRPRSSRRCQGRVRSTPPRCSPSGATAAKPTTRPDSVAALAGLTPVTKESGKHRAVHFRWACNKRFRVAMTTFADNSRHASPWAAHIYNHARAAGKDHPHAVRILARAWIRVIWRCWHDGVPYDPARHGAASNDQQPRICGLRLTQGVSCGRCSPGSASRTAGSSRWIGPGSTPFRRRRPR